MVTYEKEGSNGQPAVWCITFSRTGNQLTDNTFADSSRFFKDGNYIFFLSDRDFNLDFSSFEFDYLYNKATRVYAMV
jgi:tricorn protease